MDQESRSGLVVNWLSSLYQVILHLRVEKIFIRLKDAKIIHNFLTSYKEYFYILAIKSDFYRDNFLLFPYDTLVAWKNKEVKKAPRLFFQMVLGFYFYFMYFVFFFQVWDVERVFPSALGTITTSTTPCDGTRSRAKKMPEKYKRAFIIHDSTLFFAYSDAALFFKLFFSLFYFILPTSLCFFLFKGIESL